ncbi:acyltransferase family protein [Sphingomonas phyllosphaerae]|uniref:acyltransferase family protein n=1 Tax=Sphingomonas phyllosphaerae TaxID=257003 RepID=UPI0004123E53|nr:acyltransferase [Sphingomonas phyllosphaerae]
MPPSAPHAPEGAGTAAAGPATRFELLQVLRGLAALWVVLFHVWTLQSIRTLYEAMPSPLREIVFDDGRGGVAVFFVLSGFVIAHSLWGKQVDGRYAGTFAIRRSLRLDPAYWASIPIGLAAAAAVAMAHGEPLPWPTPATVIGHLFYLQELLGLPDIQIVYWTLTYEVQFYIVTLLGAWAWCRARAGAPTVRRAAWLLPAAFIFAAVASSLGDQHWVPRGVFLNFWFAFAAGALAYAAGWRRAGAVPTIALAVIAVIALWRAPGTDEVFNTPAMLTAIGLFGASRAGWLGAGGRQRWLIGLGAISYSLYLVHFPLLVLSGSIVRRVFGDGVIADSGKVLAYLVLCTGGAIVFWLVVEAPTHRLAQRYGRGRARTDASVPAE